MKISIHATLIAVILAFASVSSEAAGGSVTVVFSHDEAATIRAYYESTDSQSVHDKNHKGKGRKSLPPGIAKNLQRGKPLPPGISKRALPQDLLVGLPPVRHGFERVIVDGKVLLVEVATQIIHDVLVEVLIN